jgi:predicted Zn-dependent protease
VQQGLAANPKSYALHVRLGASYLAISRYTEAEMEFRNLVAAGDPLPTSYVGLAQVLLRTGRADQAATELAAAEQKLGGTFLISYFRGLALERAGKSAEAFTAFQDAITRDPNSIEAQVGLAETQLRLGKVKEAIAQLEHSRSADQKNVQIQRLLSTAYRRAGDLENATKFAQSTNAEVPSREKDLIGDFFLPSWQLPPGTSSSKH